MVRATDDSVDEEGLTEAERNILAAPFSQLNESQRSLAMVIKNKQIDARHRNNERFRREFQPEKLDQGEKI